MGEGRGEAKTGWFKVFLSGDTDVQRFRELPPKKKKEKKNKKDKKDELPTGRKENQIGGAQKKKRIWSWQNKERKRGIGLRGVVVYLGAST